MFVHRRCHPSDPDKDDKGRRDQYLKMMAIVISRFFDFGFFAFRKKTTRGKEVYERFDYTIPSRHYHFFLHLRHHPNYPLHQYH